MRRVNAPEPVTLSCGCVLHDTALNPRRCMDLGLLTGRVAFLRKLADQETDPKKRSELWLEHHRALVALGAHLSTPEAAEMQVAA